MTGFVADARCREHDSGPGHPESVKRFDAVLARIIQAGLIERVSRLTPRAITRDDLLLVHTAEYLDRAEKEIRAGAEQLSTGDTSVSPGSWDAAMCAAGSVLAAVDAVVTGEVKNAFSVHRPPGHHATPSRGMGFCVVNNVALAARHAQKSHGLKKVLIVDWDVHHGNGTQDAFYEDGTVFFFSTHQSPWYPGTGAANETGRGAGKGTTMNVPLPAGSGRTEIFAAVQERLAPAAEAFAPELILISAGFDSRKEDPLGQFTLSDSDFADLTDIVAGLAPKSARGRVVSVLEGGYNLAGLASAATAHLEALLEL